MCVPRSVRRRLIAQREVVIGANAVPNRAKPLQTIDNKGLTRVAQALLVGQRDKYCAKG
jgi:hypothetical protein